MRKRSFLLLEVLLAITLVAVFAAPLMRLPIRYYRSQIHSLEEFERRRIADWTFSEVKEILLKETIPWENLPAKGASITRPLSDAQIVIPHLPSRTVHRSFLLKCSGEKQGLHGEIFRLYKVQIIFDHQKTYNYRILVQRLPADDKR